MGIQDRDYYQDEDEPQGFNVGGTRMMVANIVIITVGIFALDSFTSETQTLLEFKEGSERRTLGVPAEDADKAVKELASQGYATKRSVLSRWLSGHLTLRSDLVQKPWNFWQLLTYGFAHSPLGSNIGFSGLAHIGFNMFMLWMFGRAVEDKYGRMEFLRFYLISIVVVGVIWIGIEMLVHGPVGHGVLGASGAVTAVVILFVLNFPNQQLLLMGVVPIKAWVMGLVLIGLNFLGALTSTGNISYESHLVGASFGLCYYYMGWNFGRLWPSRFATPDQWIKSKPKLQVHDPDEMYAELDEEADRLLDKVHRDGQDSLTKKERRLLEAYSRRMKQKKN